MSTEPGAGGATWVVLGATGFVGRAVVAAAQATGVQVLAVPAPRVLAPPAAGPEQLAALADSLGELCDGLAERLQGADVVINAAGLAEPGAPASDRLSGANALLPALVVRAADAVGCARVVHVSSAAVQGDRPVLDASDDVDPRTAYARSKAAGEAVLARLRPTPACRVVVARATSVQGEGRATTASLRRFARSPLASVAGDGRAPVPVTSLAGLGSWVVDLATAPDPPRVSLQPWEGWTTASLLRELGGREPRHLPVGPARALVATGYLLSRLLGGQGRAAVRRVELVWFGQRQAG